MIEIKAYQCDFCKKYGKSKSNIKKHEETCFHNPVTKACATCEYCCQVDKKMGIYYTTVPVCSKGEIISDIIGEKKHVSLKHHCLLWKEREDNF